MTRRWGKVLLLVGLLFGQCFAVAPPRPSNDLRVQISIVQRDAAEVEVEPGPAAAYAETRGAAPWDAPGPRQGPAYALYQRPPPPAA